MHPIAFAKAHPLGVVVSMGLGMVVGPAILGTLGSWTGINVRLPSVGNGG